MPNPLDMVTQDQSDNAPRPRVYIYGNDDRPTGTEDVPYQNRLTQAVAPAQQPYDLPALIAQVKAYLTDPTGFSGGTKVGNQLFGTGGEERYQTWPERMVRSGVTLAGDEMNSGSGLATMGLRREDVTDLPKPPGLMIAAQPGDTVRERAMDMAGLAGGGALTERPGVATLGSGPVRPGMATNPDNFLIGTRGGNPKPGEFVDGLVYHTTPTEKVDTIRKEGLKPQSPGKREWENTHWRGKNDKDVYAYTTPAKAFEHARNEKRRTGKPQSILAVKVETKDGNIEGWGQDTSANMWKHGSIVKKGPIAPEQIVDSHSLFSDTSKPGAAISASASSGPAPVFYSALEHATTNAAQETMSPGQWLGYLKNQPGVKAEELQWTGLPEWLAGQKGKVKKQDVQQYLDEHKVEIKDVTKTDASDPAAVERIIQQNLDDSLIPEFVTSEGRRPTIAEQNDMRAMVRETMADDPELFGIEGDFGNTKYSSYQLPGGENYREHLLTMPPRGKPVTEAHQQLLGEIHRRYPDTYHNIIESKVTPDEIAGLERKGIATEEEIAELQKAVKSNKDMGQSYRSSHWDEPNVLAHVRTNDRDVGGQKSLHIEEIQSDWHQQGRKQGYKQSVDRAEADKAEAVLKDLGYKIGTGRRLMTLEGKNVDPVRAPDDVANAFHKWLDESNKDYKANALSVPNAPFKTTWPELALKRMIRHAAENGYDRISWTPGEAQAARYDLSKSIESLKATPIMDQHGLKYEIRAKGRGGTTEPINSVVTEAELVNTVGKEMAQKIVDQSGGKKPVEFKGLDLKVGGEGMREFYDKMLPKMAEKIGKAHGVKVKTTEAIEPPVLTKKMKAEVNAAWKRAGSPNLNAENHGSGYDPVVVARRHVAEGKMTEADARIIEDFEQTRKEQIHGRLPALHYFDLPQSLKDHAVGKGFPLYMSGIPFPLTPVDHDPFSEGKSNVAPAWPGSEQDKMRAMNLLRRKTKGETIEPESSKWLDQYMEWVDRSLPPIKKEKK